MTAPYASLQHAEAVARAALLSGLSYDVRLDLRGEREFVSRTTIELTSAGGATFLDLKPLTLTAIELDGTRLDPERLERGRYPLELTAGEHRLVVEAMMPFRHDGEGLHRSTDPADGRDYVYAMCFMDAAPTVFACFDQPDLKAPYTVGVQCPADWTVVGNAPARQGAPGEWELGPTPPLATYFWTVVAGPWHVLRSEHDDIPLGLSCRQSIAAHLEADADELFTLTGQCLDELHRLFGIRYPFGDYHQAFVPEFNAGAMENPGCVTFRDPLVFTSRATRAERVGRATTVAHEMAHQWFGDLLTPRWWDDLWLNESFAEYLGHRVCAEATDFTDAWVESAYARRQWGLSADLRPSTHPVAGNGAVDATAALQDFDGISYAKGSAVLRQLAATIGDEAFFAGATGLMRERRFGNAAMADLVAGWERAAGRDLTGFVAQWLRTPGPDVLALDRAAGLVRRTPPAAHPADREHTIHLARGADLALSELRVSGPETPVAVGVDELVVLDPCLDTWAACELDEPSARALVAALPGVADPLVRAGVWNDLRSSVRSGAVSPATALDVVVASLPVEDESDARRRTMAWVYADLLPLAPAGGAARVHAAAVALLPHLEPGSGRQLAALRAAIATASDPGLLTAWRDGEGLPPGAEADEGLVWRAWVRLATLGATDRDELDRALAAAPGAVATIEHTKAVASLPTAEAKRFAWDRFTGAVDVPNYELEAAGLGLWRVGQEHLTAPYVERFFADLPATAQVRSGWTLAEAVDHFFPRTAIDEPTLARTRALAADTAVDTSMRRRLADQADDLAHRLAVLHRWPRAAS